MVDCTSMRWQLQQRARFSCDGQKRMFQNGTSCSHTMQNNNGVSDEWTAIRTNFA